MFDRGVCLIEIVLEENNTLLIILIWRGASVFDDQRSCGGDGLKAYVGVVKVRSSIIVLWVNLVVKASMR